MKEKKVAIIGAGIGGSAAAFHLHSLSRMEADYSITIYEKEPKAGGRVDTFTPPEAKRRIIEAGASSFFKDDSCVMTAMKDVGLREQRHRRILQRPQSSAIWDGHSLNHDPKCDLESLSWKDMCKLILKYGASPWRLRQQLLAVLDRWRSFTRSTTFVNLKYELERVGLNGGILGSARSFSQNAGNSQRFATEFIQPCMKVRVFKI